VLTVGCAAVGVILLGEIAHFKDSFNNLINIVLNLFFVLTSLREYCLLLRLVCNLGEAANGSARESMFFACSSLYATVFLTTTADYI